MGFTNELSANISARTDWARDILCRMIAFRSTTGAEAGVQGRLRLRQVFFHGEPRGPGGIARRDLGVPFYLDGLFLPDRQENDDRIP
jgi:hypothetical protein